MPKKKHKWCSRTGMPLPHYTLCTSQKQFDKVQKRMGIPKTDRGVYLHPGADGICWQFCKPEGGLACVVCVDISGDPDPEYIQSVLIHEAVHVFQYHVEHLAEHKPGDEYMAYSIQTIATQLIAMYRETLA